ncbi:phospholipid/cholesterol/gamma-HCH transport system substrate-binding protein [Loktanella sp. PT4BL]|jgi:phospholipid/cholesterol/gamma-HCH transport system substrate-binding protein|uniref:MlaD family protein n=1 Tax=Loktanella sp. PT4BL TaxID=2135611 RepID=UPI000D767EDC|nr:MlaD family protein [Loktanella sp. PT4BL]PXW72085.1 phospholipid/cholesterol/gamma-HCH transport system substrate-binding protein [Loktanella sp. PT4BL]
METRANFIIIGLFTLLGILGGLGFFLWLASVQIDRQYAQYGVLFDNVSGLDQSAEVLFNGVSVGRVTGIRIWEDDPSKAYVAVEIDSTTPVAVDTIARLESQGVTGVAYIALSGGAPGAPVIPLDGNEVPIIPSRQSTFQSLVSSAPDLIADASRIVSQLEQLTGTENQERVRSILENVDNATDGLEQALTDFSDISETLRAATAQVTGFVAEFDGVGNSARATLDAADGSFAAITETFGNANAAIENLGPAIDQANAAIAAINTLVTEDFAPLADDLRTTLGNADTALASADQAFVRADGLMVDDLGPALAETRAALTDLAETVATVTDDVPAIMADLRAGVAEARSAIAAISPGMRDFGALGGEARAAVRALNDLIRRINQDPAGFVLDNRVPEYRR